MVHTDIKIEGYNEKFVERFHPNYNCDEIAWLDDCYCALNNESENRAHWAYLADIVGKGWEREYCMAIWDDVDEDELVSQMQYEGFSSIHNFGAYLADKYKDTIEEDIERWEAIIMEEAKRGFYKEFGINED